MQYQEIYETRVTLLIRGFLLIIINLSAKSVAK